MLQQLKNTANITYTENGAVTYRSTESECLDLFATIGALRSQSGTEAENRFLRAYAENPDLAMKILFYARDVRGGLGERMVFRTLLKWLANNEPDSLLKNLAYIPEYGRWDDILVLLDSPAAAQAVTLLHQQLETDQEALKNGEAVSLMGKWLPSVNASNPETVHMAKQLAKAFAMNDAEYRKVLAALRAEIRIIENSLRERDYSFDYSKQPSKAMFKYRNAFARNDKRRYTEYLQSVSNGTAILHTGTLMPYEIVSSVLRGKVKNRDVLDVTWKALEDFTNDENAIVVADGSGSMYWNKDPQPIAVALSLAIYYAERNHGAFHNHFITFSTTPRLVEIKGQDICEKVRYCSTFNECANTDLLAVFKLILKTARENHLPQSKLPSKIYIVSDMEFDSCTNNSSVGNFKFAKRLFNNAGYKLPQVVFWNVDSRNNQQPVKKNEQGVALVSGFTARIFSQVMNGSLDPYSNMMNVIGSERYEKIKA